MTVRRKIIYWQIPNCWSRILNWGIALPCWRSWWYKGWANIMDDKSKQDWCWPVTALCPSVTPEVMDHPLSLWCHSGSPQSSCHCTEEQPASFPLTRAHTVIQRYITERERADISRRNMWRFQVNTKYLDYFYLYECSSPGVIQRGERRDRQSKVKSIMIPPYKIYTLLAT